MGTFSGPGSSRRAPWATRDRNTIKQRIDVSIVHDVVNRESRLVNRTDKPMRQRWICPSQFKHPLYGCTFEVEVRYSAFDGRRFTDGHRELLWIPRKAVG